MYVWVQTVCVGFFQILALWLIELDFVDVDGSSIDGTRSIFVLRCACVASVGQCLPKCVND